MQPSWSRSSAVRRVGVLLALVSLLLAAPAALAHDHHDDSSPASECGACLNPTVTAADHTFVCLEAPAFSIIEFVVEPTFAADVSVSVSEPIRGPPSAR